MRVFLDTNVLVSAVATRGLCADVVQVVLAEHELVTSERVIDELRRTLGNRLRVPDALVAETLELLLGESHRTSQHVEPGVEVRDPDDARVLGDAIGGNADVLVTGDQDLLSVAEDATIPILTPRAFWERLRSASGR